MDSIEKNGLDFAKNLGLQNTRDLCKLIQVCQIYRPSKFLLMLVMKWNEDNKYDLACHRNIVSCKPHHRIRFMRLSSEMFPFASHAKYGYSLDYAAAELKVNMSFTKEQYILTLS